MYTVSKTLLFFFLVMPLSFTQWNWLNPLPQGNSLGQVKFINGSTGWSVGEGGVILKTTNGGEVWRVQNSGTTNDLLNLFILDENTVYAVGSYGKMLKTTDAGSNWNEIVSGVSQTLYDIYFIDISIGFAVGMNGILIKTTDGGTSWNSQIVENDYNNVRVIFFDSNNGVIASKFWGAPLGKIFKTTDGGASWDATWVSDYLHDMFFVYNNNGYAVGGSFVATGINNIMLKTTNGGDTWETLIEGDGSSFSGVSFLTAEIGYIAGTYGLIKKTSNGGTSWSDLSIEMDSSFTDIEIIDDNNLILVGYRGLIVSTADAGVNWTINNTSLTTLPIVSIHFSDDNYGYAIGSVWNRHIILRTTNGGNDWVSQGYTQTDFSISEVFCIDENNAYAVGSSGLLKTTNGGNEWVKIIYSTYFGEVVGNKVNFLNDKIGYVLNGYYIFKTTDSGNTWVSGLLSYTDYFTDLFPVDQNIVYVAGADGKLYKTTNGGDDWQQQNSGTTNDLFTIVFLDSTTGYAAGQDGIIISTTNGGNNWNQVNTIGGKIVDMWFFDINNWYALENQGAGGPKLLTTTDGGINWTEEQKQTDRLLSVCFNNSNEGFITGDNGVIIKHVGTKPIPVAPSNLNTVPFGTNGVQLNWQDNASNESNYIVYRFNNPIAVLPANSTSYIDYVNQLTEFTYKIRATNSYGVSSYSNSSSVNVTNVIDESDDIKIYMLFDNYPNPFNPNTTIKYQVPRECSVSIKVYDLLGAEILELLNEKKDAGIYEIEFNAASLPSGVYIYKLTDGHFIDSKKMLLLK